MTVAASNARLGGTAVVCGAGMAGLLAARVLADFYERVVIVERDELTDEPAPRKGVPQGRYIHVLVVGGQRILEELFPGFVDEMVKDGAPYACVTSARKRYHVTARAWQPRFESDLWALHCSRGMLERGVRRRVLALPNVQLLGGRRVTGVLAEDDGSVVHGVRIDDEGEVTGDLVVDATGRTSAGPRWLADLGYPAPAEFTVNGFWGYASRNYRMPADWAPDWSALVTLPTGQAGDTRGTTWSKQENGRWLLTLFGCAKDYPPRDATSFADWLASLPVPDFAEPLRTATPLDEIVVWRQTMNRLRRYDELTRRPAGLVFLGDSVCTLNPVYGQGMSVACLGARELRAALADGLDDLVERFQRRLADTIRFSWTVATGADHDIVGSQGDTQTPEEAGLADRWRRALLLVKDDPEIMRRYYETLMLVRPPDWLYHGDIADRLSSEANPV